MDFMLNVAMLCPQGLGDAFLMMILAHHFQKKGHVLTFYHPSHHLLKDLFPTILFAHYPPIADFEKVFSHYDLVLMQNDNSEKAWALITLRKEQKLPNITFLFPRPCPKAYEDSDYLFNQNKSVAKNLQLASQRLLQMPEATKENGIVIPKGTKSLYKNRIILHPTSKDKKKCWKKQQFLSLASHLKKMGYQPVFTVSNEEKPFFEDIISQGFTLSTFNSLIELSSFIYESGYLIGNDSALGHLASNLGIPTLTISGNPKNTKVWHPDWCLNCVVTLPFDLPNFKGIGFKFRDNYWQNFISVGKVLRNFKQLTLKKGCNDT